MSNHSSDIDPEMEKKFADIFDEVIKKRPELLEEAMREQAKISELGATGQMPDGKLTERDAGELKLAIAAVDGRIVVNFGQPVTWFGLQPEQAVAVAEGLLNKVKEVEQAKARRAAAAAPTKPSKPKAKKMEGHHGMDDVACPACGTDSTVGCIEG